MICFIFTIQSTIYKYCELNWISNALKISECTSSSMLHMVYEHNLYKNCVNIFIAQMNKGEFVKLCLKETGFIKNNTQKSFQLIIV